MWRWRPCVHLYDVKDHIRFGNNCILFLFTFYITLQLFSMNWRKPNQWYNTHPRFHAREWTYCLELLVVFMYSVSPDTDDETTDGPQTWLPVHSQVFWLVQPGQHQQVCADVWDARHELGAVLREVLAAAFNRDQNCHHTGMKSRSSLHDKIWFVCLWSWLKGNF